MTYIHDAVEIRELRFAVGCFFRELQYDNFELAMSFIENGSSITVTSEASEPGNITLPDSYMDRVFSSFEQMSIIQQNYNSFGVLPEDVKQQYETAFANIKELLPNKVQASFVSLQAVDPWR